MTKEITLAALDYADEFADPVSLLHKQRTASFSAGANWANAQREAEINALRENLADLKASTLYELNRANRLEAEVKQLRELLKDVDAFFKKKMEG